MRTKGLTLLEVLIVLSVVAILVAVTLSASSNRGFENVDVKGHNYLREKTYYRIMPLVHDPECPKCKAEGLSPKARRGEYER